MFSAVVGRSRPFFASALKQRSQQLSRPLPAMIDREVLSDNNCSYRSFSSSKNKKFSPRRRPPADYRPVKPRGDKYKKKKGNKGVQVGKERFFRLGDKIVELGDEDRPASGTEGQLDFDYDGLTAKFGVDAAEAIRQIKREREIYKGGSPTIEDYLRDMDYLTSAEGSTEDLVGERRALSFETQSEEEKEKFLADLEDAIEHQRIKDLDLEPDVDLNENTSAKNAVIDESDPLTTINPNQLAHGEWGELVIRVDRNIKLWRGGRIESYRALVIGGNLNGCAGFGTGKAFEARQAVIAASRKCKRNIFFVDRYQNNSLTRDLVGKSNSCRVVLRATNRGLRGNPLVCEILKYFGITNCTAKAVHGNRSQFNVVRATFKALATHESMEEIALKRGKRIVSLDRGRKMQL